MRAVHFYWLTRADAYLVGKLNPELPLRCAPSTSGFRYLTPASSIYVATDIGDECDPCLPSEGAQGQRGAAGAGPADGVPGTRKQPQPKPVQPKRCLKLTVAGFEWMREVGLRIKIVERMRTQQRPTAEFNQFKSPYIGLLSGMAG